MSLVPLSIAEGRGKNKFLSIEITLRGSSQKEKGRFFFGRIYLYIRQEINFVIFFCISWEVELLQR